jgi:hypothetical protein
MLFTYDKILEITRIILDDEVIPKENLTITYKLPAIHHRKLNEEIFFRQNKSQPGASFEPADKFEVDVDGILFRFEVLPPASETSTETI